jgi:hypothetical protein
VLKIADGRYWRVLNKSILSKASPDCWRAFERVTNKENSFSLDGDLKRCIVTKNRLHVGRANQTNWKERGWEVGG